MKDEVLKNCPDCNGEVKRLIGSGAGTIFKGTGFYQTDYKNSSKPADTKASEKPKSADKPLKENKVEKKSTTDK
jgi:predicted nucleic acid-binding Zn ribbon protein